MAKAINQIVKDIGGKATPKGLARTRYTVKPHEARLMIEMARRCPKPIDRNSIKVLARHFGLTLKPVVEILERHQFEIDTRTKDKPEKAEAPAEKKVKRPTLKMGKDRPDPVPTQAEKIEVPNEANALKRVRSELELLKSQLTQKENQLTQARQELTAREAALASREIEVEEAMAYAERLAEECGREIECREKAQARDPDAPTIPLYSGGMVRQMMLTLNAEWTQKIEQVRAEYEGPNYGVPESMRVG